MPGPAEKHKLPSGMGALIRYSPKGAWTWQRYDSRRKKNVCNPTRQVNRSKAEQFVFQEVAKRESSTFRLQDARILFSTVAEEYFEARKAGHQCKRLREGSLRKLHTTLNSFASFIGEGYESVHVSQIDGVLLAEYVQHEAARVSADSANRSLDSLRSILDHAHKHGYILHNPSKNIERAFDDAIEEDDDAGLLGYPCPTPEEVRSILAAAKPSLVATGKRANNGSQVGRAVYSGINQNDYTDLFLAICLTGMRLGEARFLTWQDVDLTANVVLIKPGRKNGVYWQPKTRASIRRIAIVPELAVALRRIRGSNKKNEWVFETRRATQIGASNPTRRLGEVCKQLGLRKYVVHSLRKYWASTVAQQGMDAMVMLKMFGHSDFQLILSTYYSQNDDARMVQQASKIDFGLGLPKAG